MPPQKADVRESVLDSNPDNWEFVDMPQTWVHWPEQISIEDLGHTGSVGRRDIDQPDFVSLPDEEHDQESQIRISHQGVPFDQLPVLSLDGHRINMVKPDIDRDDGTRYLTEYEAKLSQIMSQDDFLRKQGGTIDVEIRGTF
ncbi:hypothetical protein [Halorubrum halodurans]|uniref:hypothetical protein n=1 Tax=Halorubrum halodurans TaxID=1383851 RepID=UPI00117A378E|nr:hypothetical protein [Halorubrum halodurans]